MGIVRVVKTKNYTTIANYPLRDKNLSLKAKGLIALMLSLPDDWDYSIAGLVTQVKEGRTAVTSALDELIKNGYVIREAIRENGRISDWNYTVYEMPNKVILPSENLKVENLIVENQLVENQQQLNTDINKIKKEDQIKTKESTGTGALVKHPRNFSKQTLTDDLQSGKDIDEQKKEKKKASEYDKCYKEIDDRYTDKNINSLLHQYLDWSYHSTDPQRIRNLKVFKKRLDELDKLDNKEKVIKQSLQKQWHCFYEVSAQTFKGNTVDNVILESQSRSSRNVEDIIAQRAERNGII